jgi:hypothetical protein
MWYSGNENIEQPIEDIQEEIIELDDKFVESVRKSVQGGLKSNLESKSFKGNTIIITTVIGVGVALYYQKSPITFGIIGSLIGIIINKK